jgi:hypothetical protein
MKAYLHTHEKRLDGTWDCLLTRAVECREKPLWWQEKGLSYTASGYGSRIPTSYQIHVNGRWRRVYCRIYSNVGSLFIGQTYDGTARVQIEMD